MAQVKKIRVRNPKTGVIKEVEAHQEKSYSAIGWEILKENNTNPYINPYAKK